MCWSRSFAERESHAAYFLQEQKMTRYDAVNYISHGIAKRPGMSEQRSARGADEEISETTEPDDQKNDALEAYCVNLNEKAKTGKIDPLIGRDAEIQRTIQDCAAAPRTTRCLWAIRGLARLRLLKGWPDALSMGCARSPSGCHDLLARYGLAAGGHALSR
jgi:ATP-dependent Clp protease ATP-binding subunit ClpA